MKAATLAAMFLAMSVTAGAGMSSPGATGASTKRTDIAAGPLTISKRAFDKIIYFETGGQAYYTKRLQRPTYPGGASGVTVGVGYDCGYNGSETIRSDWNHIAAGAKDALAKTSGVRGTRARTAAAAVRWIVIPWGDAEKVFRDVSVPKFGTMTSRAFPGLPGHRPDVQGALLSIGFNRGLSMSGSSRSEMRAIKAEVPKGDRPEVRARIASLIRDMKRLWRGKGLDGLLSRREAEAVLVETAE